MKGYAKKYHCVRCYQRINPRLSTCPYCKTRQPVDLRANALGEKVVDIECKSCGCKQSFYQNDKYLESASCVDCGKITYSSTEGKIPLPKAILPQGAKCPYCGSTYTKKISTTSKVAHVATLGVLGASKVVHQWHCKNCKSDF